MAFQAPRHAVRFGQIHRRHVIDWTVAAETTDAAVNVRGMIIIDVIDRAIDPHPLDRVAAVPALPHRLQLWIVLLHLRVAIHASLGVGDIRVRRHFHKAVTIPAIHSQLCHVNVVRKRHRLDRLVADLRVFWRRVVPRGCAQSTGNHNAAHQQLDR